ncbi:MAG: SDR family oxidoreductase [Solirubrobacterales bacterium]
MSYFVTGATGFIGRNLVELLLERNGTVYVLVREGSKGRLEELRNRWGVSEDPGSSESSGTSPSRASASPTRTWRCSGATSTTCSTSRRSTT